jgi:hypothetical protein
MGRGLSELQRYILTEAGKRQRVYYADILEGFFGWAPVKPIARWKAGDVRGGVPGYPEEQIPENEVGSIKHPGHQYFSRRKIGEKNYRKVLATLSRTCLRLGQRGLVTCLRGTMGHWSGIEITDKGREQLLVSSKETFRRTNQ